MTGTIARIVPDDEDTELVYVDIGGASILSRVTRAASMALGLRVGLPVWALVKSVVDSRPRVRRRAANFQDISAKNRYFRGIATMSV